MQTNLQWTVLEHPLIEHKLGILRDEKTPSAIFRSLVTELTMLAVYESTRGLATEEVEVQTPVAKTVGRRVIVDPRPLVVPILRAGLGMLEGMTRMLPSCEVGFLGMKRDEETLEPVTYTNRLPEDLTGRQCFIIDPMLATGGSLRDAIDYLVNLGATDITCLNILAAPEGKKMLEEHFSVERYPNLNLRIYVTALDKCLNEHGYIVPGLGDAGDRLYGPY
ncbi:MAG: uracil phosphoribosyltransferase [Candidatus Ancillula sp.]|jgi:uracil phosphoribosyltransferase|nr:uracil phosphoribosyltransferase [Candidatus Ancillula sp.]